MAATSHNGGARRSGVAPALAQAASRGGAWAARDARILWRLARVGLHVLWGLAQLLTLAPFVGWALRRVMIAEWSASFLTICRIKARVNGADARMGAWRARTGRPFAAAGRAPRAAAPGPLGSESEADASRGAPAALIVCNHISWLDPIVINAHRPARFVCKSDVARWPFLGWLARGAGSFFIRRGDKKSAKAVSGAICESLKAGRSAAFFPEGTTTDGSFTLPFKSGLFQAAVKAQAPVIPAVLRYLTPEGEPDSACAYDGDKTFLGALTALLSRKETVAELTYLPAIPPQGMDRRDLRDAAQKAIDNRLRQAARGGWGGPGKQGGRAGRDAGPGAGCQADAAHRGF